MTKRGIEQVLAPKPEARQRIYAYSIADEAHAGLLMVGQTTRDVKRRVALVKKGFENVELEWMRCSVEDVRAALAELRAGRKLSGVRHETFAMHREQAEAVNKTHAYSHSIWSEDMHAVPRFLWNAMMRFGKTGLPMIHRGGLKAEMTSSAVLSCMSYFTCTSSSADRLSSCILSSSTIDSFTLAIASLIPLSRSIGTARSRILSHRTRVLPIPDAKASRSERDCGVLSRSHM
jgi:hypothetical protein